MRLRPSVLIPWVNLDSGQEVQSLSKLDSDIDSMARTEGFEWREVRLFGKKQQTFMDLINTPQWEHRLSSLLRQMDETSSLSRCDRMHIGTVITTEDLIPLVYGYNDKPDYLNLPCDILGCDPAARCSLSYSAESVAFNKLWRDPFVQTIPPRLRVISTTVPNLESINLCEQNGVSVVMFDTYRLLTARDMPAVSLKTIKSEMLFIKVDR